MVLNVDFLGAVLLFALFKLLKSNFEVRNSRTDILAMDPSFRHYIKSSLYWSTKILPLALSYYQLIVFNSTSSRQFYTSCLYNLHTNLYTFLFEQKQRRC